MSEQFAEASVRVVPDLTGFATKLRKELQETIRTRVENTTAARVRIAPALTRNFIGDLRGQVNAAVLRAEKGVRPIRVRATVLPLSTRELRELERVVAPRGARATATAAAAASPVSAVSTGATAAAASAALGLQNATALMNTEFGRSARLLGEVAGAAGIEADALQAGAASTKSAARAKGELTVAEEKLVQAQLAQTAAQLQQNNTELQQKAIRAQQTAATIALNNANTQLAVAQSVQNSGITASNRLMATHYQITVQNAQAQIQAARAVQASATAMLQHIAATQASAGALNQHSAASAKTAANISQLRRGVLATSLSFLGIRGATLAASARFLIGAAAIATFAKALQGATRFTDQLNVFRATTSATAADMERVSAAARQLGVDITLPGVTSGDAAEAMTELAKAGLSVQDSIDGARGILQLATAAAISNADAVELAANALNAFSLAGKDATAVADTFANAANAAQGSISDIGAAFAQASAAGRQVGLTFQDTTVFLTLLARAGLRGSDAGTSLRTGLLRLISPTDKAREALEKLGIVIRDAQGNFRPDVFIQIAQATANMTPNARDAFAALIGGQDAFRAITILGRESIGSFTDLRAELRRQGTAARLAAARTQGLRGSLDALQNVLEGIGNRFGRAVSPGLQGFVQDLTRNAEAVSTNERLMRTLAGTLEFTGAAYSALSGAISAVAPVALFAASALETAVDAIGVPTILAGVAAWKLLPPIFIRVRAAAAVMSTALALSALAGINPLKFGLVGLIRLINPWVVGVAAAGAALFYLTTRTTEAERRTQQLRRAMSDFARATGQAQAAADRLFSARRGQQTSGTSVQSAILEQRRAQAALAGSTAPRGSFEFLQLQNQLTIATQNVTFAVQDQRKALQELNAAQEELWATQGRLQATRAETITRLADSLEAAVTRTRRFGGRGITPGQLAAENEIRSREEIVELLEKEGSLLRESDDANERSIGARLQLLAELQKRIDGTLEPKEIKLLINARDFDTVLERVAPKFGVEGEKATALFVKRVKAGLSHNLGLAEALRQALEDVPAIMAAAGSAGSDAFMRAAAAGIRAGTRAVQAAVSNLGRRIQGELAGISREETSLRIAGAGDAAFLANLEKEEAALRSAIAKVKPGPSREKLRTQLADNLEEQRRLREQMSNDAKQAAKDAEDDQKELDENLLAALGVRRDRRLEAIQTARLSESLQDDLVANRRIKRFVLAQIAIIKERVKNAAVQKAAIRELNAILRDLDRDFQQLQRDRRQQTQDRIAESNQLDIEFASTTENRRAEINARTREIRRLQKLIDDTKKGTVEYKRLRNAIAEQQRAIDELRQQESERNNASARLAFEFLQAQQGFAANVMSNILGQDVLAGTVGGSSARTLPGSVPRTAGRRTNISTPQTQAAIRDIPGLEGFGGVQAQVLTKNLQRQGQLAASREQGVSRGQGATVIDVLNKMLIQLQILTGDRQHPELKHQRVRMRSSMDMVAM